VKKLNSKLLQNELKNVSKKIDAAKSNVEINTLAQELVTELLEAEFCSLWFYDQNNMTLVRERDNATPTTLSLNEKRGILYKCFMTQEAKIYNYLASEKDYIASVDNPDNIKMRAKIIYPLIDNDKLIGIVTAYNSVKYSKKFRQDDMEVLEALSPYLIDILYKMHKCSDKNCNCYKVVPEKSQSLVVENMQRLERRSSDRRKSEKHFSEKMLANMSNFIHDIRTPANTLQGFLELLEEQITDKRLKEYLLNAKESAGFISELTTSMLDRISLHREDEVAVIKEVDTVSFFAEIAEMFVSNMYAKKIAFNIYIDPMLPKSIRIDSMKLKRVLMNLLGNAYKFTPYNRSIEFAVKYNKENKTATIYVKDKGIGIAKEKQEEVFKAFTQAEETTSIEYGGTGLGLSICAEYVKNLGGKLELQSELEKGSTFYFTIPLDVKDEIPSLKPLKDKNLKITVLMDPKSSFSLLNIARYLVQMSVEKKSIEAVASYKDIPEDTTHLIVYQSKFDQNARLIMERCEKVLVVEEKLFSMHADELDEKCELIFEHGYFAGEVYHFINSTKMPRVLIVDDDKTSVVLLEKILESEYCEVEVASNGQVALEMIIDSHKRNDPYSVVYMDNNMPKMSGLEVMKRVREFEKDNYLLPIYAVSTSGDRLDLNSDGKNFDAYVGKPFRVDEIRTILYH
jgi:CheY-like chemotaxis protein/nitrogen-specific signal transduction histidine kinase